jgi:hypothetical protein
LCRCSGKRWSDRRKQKSHNVQHARQNPVLQRRFAIESVHRSSIPEIKSTLQSSQRSMTRTQKGSRQVQRPSAVNSSSVILRTRPSRGVIPRALKKANVPRVLSRTAPSSLALPKSTGTATGSFRFFLLRIRVGDDAEQRTRLLPGQAGHCCMISKARCRHDVAPGGANLAYGHHAELFVVQGCAQVRPAASCDLLRIRHAMA